MIVLQIQSLERHPDNIKGRRLVSGLLLKNRQYAAQILRYIRPSELMPEILEMDEQKQIGFQLAVYLTI